MAVYAVIDVTGFTLLEQLYHSFSKLLALKREYSDSGKRWKTA